MKCYGCSKSGRRSRSRRTRDRCADRVLSRATGGENFRLFRFAAEKDTVIFTHPRDLNIAAMQEAVANAAVNGTSLHIVHINSVSLGEIDVSLAMVEAAKTRA